MIERAIKDNAQLEMIYLKPNDTKSKRVVKPIEAGQQNYKGKTFPAHAGVPAVKRKDERMFRAPRIPWNYSSCSFADYGIKLQSLEKHSD